VPDDDSGVESDSSDHWFSDRALDVLIFKINRRPLQSSQLALFDPPDDLLEHLKLVLEASYSSRSGQRTQRNWRMGNLRFDDARRVVIGRIGWTRSVEALEGKWDEEARAFEEKWTSHEDSAVSAFAIDVRSELVGVLKHPSFSTELVVNKMLERMLQAGEDTLPNPGVSWNVDPMGDQMQFDEWFSSVDQLNRLTVTVKRPNPDNAEEFERMERELDDLEAESLQLTAVARDENVGLDKSAVRNNSSFKAAIAAAMRSYMKKLIPLTLGISALILMTSGCAGVSASNALGVLDQVAQPSADVQEVEGAYSESEDWTSESVTDINGLQDVADLMNCQGFTTSEINEQGLIESGTCIISTSPVNLYSFDSLDSLEAHTDRVIAGGKTVEDLVTLFEYSVEPTDTRDIPAIGLALG